jgi:hypothetical protein
VQPRDAVQQLWFPDEGAAVAPKDCSGGCDSPDQIHNRAGGTIALEGVLVCEPYLSGWRGEGCPMDNTPPGYAGAGWSGDKSTRGMRRSNYRAGAGGHEVT